MATDGSRHLRTTLTAGHVNYIDIGRNLPRGMSDVLSRVNPCRLRGTSDDRLKRC